ncbi:rhomboid family intramembrane serine protease [Streptomyces abyssomicinicus]|uniref:rhomboid family intramembrane serine protease n=1 Tax=Streptomyces abyssomicinicus TaxID=574929 RepID=UPI00124FD59D|nr:rhomboid family intramembrane serine protease [Streptomyces abyssomicinicus]
MAAGNDPGDGSPRGQEQDHTLPGCYRHPNRETGIRCTRCDRPICTDCMINASVGFQCPECVRDGAKTGSSAPRTLTGAPMVADTRLVTKILLGINLAVFLAVQTVPGLATHLMQWPQGIAVLGEWHRLVTSMFTHVDLRHIALNMLTLWLVGGPLEAALGRARYLALYLVSGLAGSALGYLLMPADSTALGASGATFGLFGALLMLQRRLNRDLRPVLLLLVLNLALPFVPGTSIGWQAHVGGLVAGGVIGFAMLRAKGPRRTLIQYGSCALVLVAAVGITLLRTAQLT